MRRCLPILAVIFFFVLLLIHPARPCASQETLRLDEAIASALEYSDGARIARAKVDEAQAKIDEISSKKKMRILVAGTGGYNTNPIDEKIGKGAFDEAFADFIDHPEWGEAIEELMPIPSKDVSILQGDDWFYGLTLTAVQPLSQQGQINTGINVARAQTSLAEAEAASIEAEIRYGVEELYYGLLVADRKIVTAKTRIAAAGAQLRHVQNAVEVGEALPLAASGLSAELMKARADQVEAAAEHDRFRLALNDLVGRPAEQPTRVSQDLPPSPPPQTFETYLASAQEYNPELLSARRTESMATLGEQAADQAKTPDINAFASLVLQGGLPVIPRQFGLIGLTFAWSAVDFGEREAQLRQSKALHEQAQANASRICKKIEREIRTELANLRHADALVDLATQARTFRLEALQLAADLVEEGMELDTKELEAQAELAQAESDLLGAKVNRRLVLARLERLAGSAQAPTGAPSDQGQ
ncbi:MAG: hypothetical protein DRJ61_04210 [Acidobacteria bacterium]|nr:MAG: hypothetical protein DRJ61_04210 [Acidobacteriota bacterium]